MAQDALQELRSTISDTLKKFWKPSKPESNPRFGVAQTAEATMLREDVAQEIADMLQKDPSKEASFNSANSSDDGHVEELPLGARLKMRGIFEDDWTARTDEQHPWPIVLIHGTVDSKGAWQTLGGELRRDGWAVFAPDYGARATGLIPNSARQVGAYIDAVLSTTGAEKAILIGHSQGGLTARYWMRLLGGAAKVKHLICIGSPNHGTTRGGIISPLIATKRSSEVMDSIIDSYFGPSGRQQIVGSAVLDEVNSNGDIDGGLGYTCIATKSDAVVVPPETCFLDSREREDATVRNIYVQDFDKNAVVLHHELPSDKRVRAIVRAVVAALHQTIELEELQNFQS